MGGAEVFGDHRVNENASLKEGVREEVVAYEVRVELQGLLEKVVTPAYVVNARERKVQQQRMKKLEKKKAKAIAQNRAAIMAAPVAREELHAAVNNTITSSKNRSRVGRIESQTSGVNRTAKVPRPKPSELQLDAKLVKRIKSISKRANCYVLSVFELLWEHLESRNSETRILSLLLWDVLFCRSVKFREATEARIQEFILLTVGDERRSNGALPPPKDAAAALHKMAIEIFEKWHDTYGARYQRLRNARRFLERSLKIQFPKAAARAATHKSEKR